ncbi:lactate racemase domain-containing protein [Chloroflexota bacterium]
MMVKVPQFPWYGDTELELDFPSSWEVVTCEMAGKDAPKLSEEEMQAAFLNPIGTPRISKLARNKKEVVIIFDDFSRPTKAAELVPYVLQELREGGIKDDNIRFVAALGTHGAMKLMDFVKKLGQAIVQRYPVYNHNPYENCTCLGTTSRGTPVSINSEVMSCDLKIAIGAIVPHITAGFGSGGKLILPGVAHVDTIWANHHNVGGRSMPTKENPLGKLDPSLGWGKVEGNVLRLDMEEAARMAGLDVTVNVVVNLHRDTVGLFVGDLVAAHREGVKLARQIYTTDSPGEADIVVANAYGKANEAVLAVQLGCKLLKPEGGDLVIIANIPEGQICHYASRSFGKSRGGRLWGPRKALPPRTKRMIALGPYIDRAGLDWLGPPELITIANNWSEIIDILKDGNGDKPRVLVIPDATIQYFPDRGEKKSTVGRFPDLAGEAI